MHSLCLRSLSLAVATVLLGLAPAVAEPVDFNRDIKPILSNRCYFCHGPDPEERQGGIDGLRLDTREGALEDLGGHAAIVPGDAAASMLIERITSAEEGVIMPPLDSGHKLTPGEIKLLRQWIEQGAPYAEHWSYVPPVRPELPHVKRADWPRTPVDHFILARLEQQELTPSPEADATSLVRRLFLDLTGLPPRIEDVDAFVADTDPAAYEKLVDRLLSDKAYGEHWARMWLDLARYADSAGYADDPARTIWLYRDYVIDSINANKPFDQFTIEQIAGDLLPGATDEQLIATAFHRNTLTNNEGGTDDEEFRNAAIVDRVNTTLAVWMGTTMACAQCHTHKYDPITQEEYFKVFAILNNTQDADQRDESPLHAVYTAEQQRQRQVWEEELREVETIVQTPTPELAAAQEAWAAEFPHDLAWQALEPMDVQSQAGSVVSVDGALVAVAAGAETDTYTLTLPLPAQPLRALRLETLTDDSLPKQGPGHGGGNFVITGIQATLVPAESSSFAGRYVRIEIPGPQKILSLAEVEVFAGEQNIARQGTASQSSTAFDGPAQLAIDGNTDGRFADAKSTTHTAISDNPWWEVDLQSNRAIDRVVIWNRTDLTTVQRLKDFRITILNAAREPLWQQMVDTAPEPNVELAPGGPRSIRFSQAIADHSQSGFDAAFVLNNPEPKSKGWAIGGAIGSPHQLVLLADDAVEVPAGSRLTLTLEQQSVHAHHTLGRFRVSATADERTGAWATTPAAVIEALAVPSAARSQDQQNQIAAFYRTIAPQLAGQRQRAAELRQLLAEVQPVTVPVMRELPPEQRRITRLQERGNFMNLGQEVEPGTPEVFPPLPADRPADRLALAQWLVDEANPLTPRVIANRYWERLFGTGIVATSEEFGSQGELPSHPELLDWLAMELVRLKWDTRALVKLIVMSSTYRQSSRVDPKVYELDPDNRLLARGPRFRMGAEMIRDQALAVAGLLSEKLHGPPVNPPQPTTGLSAAFGSGIDWKTSVGEDRYRRGLYTTWRRSNPYPSMTTFDAPNREVCTLRRGRSNTPLQALVTLNDPVFVEAAQGLARRMMLGGGQSLEDRAVHGFRLCLSRHPRQEELDRLVQLYQTAHEELSTRREHALQLATDPVGPLPAGVDAVELAAWTTVANVLLNLDETLMRR